MMILLVVVGDWDWLAWLMKLSTLGCFGVKNRKEEGRRKKEEGR
jgi:hypothetical protein